VEGNIFSFVSRRIRTMRKTTFILLILLASNGSFAQYQVMLSNDYPPYNYLNEKNELVGFNIDIINAINELYGSDIVVSGDSWGAINRALDSVKINAIGGAHYPGKSDDDFIYTRSAINTSHCFLYNSDHYKKFSIELFRTLKEPTVALWQNDVIRYYVLSINPSTRFISLNSYEDLISALSTDTVTCIFAQRVGSMYYAKEQGMSNIVPLHHRILERNMGFKVSNTSPELAEMLDNGLEVILANGEYQRIYDKWIEVYNDNDDKWQKYLKYILIAGVLVVTLFLILLVVNWILKAKVRSRTKDLERQLDLNSQIMLELEKQKVKAEESDKMKSSFLANMSHEIRTPMNGILGFAELLKSVDYSSEEQAKFIGIIQQSGNRMLGTINNIIDVSKLESGMENLLIKEVDIQSMMKELFHFFTPEAKAKGLELNLAESDSNSIQSFLTDEYKLNSILTNLIKNALKFTLSGSIGIKYSCDSQTAEFWITDTGIGIPPNQQKNVFDQFVQADFSHSKSFEGSGLGLSISKAYANLLKGEISLDSEIHKGSTFYVRIPNYKEK